MSLVTTPIFLNAISILLQNNDDSTKNLIDELIVQHYEETQKSRVAEDSLTKKFVTMLEQLRKTPNTDVGKKERNTLLISFLSDTEIKNDQILSSAVRESFTEAEDPDEDRLERVKKNLAMSLLWNKYNKQVKQMWNKLSAYNTTTDTEKQELYLNDVVNLSRNIVNMNLHSVQNTGGAVERVLFADKDSLKKSLQQYKKREVDNVLRTGLQGLNRMLGKRRGLALGESLCIYALMHNFKSGLLMSIARGIVRFNTPPKDCKGIPVVLFVSLENEANRNMMWLYRTAYETTKGESSINKSDEEVIEFIHEFYNRGGYQLILERWAGSKFGFDEYVSLVEELESQGYSVIVSIIDYANKMKKTRIGKKENARDDLQITELFENMCTYNKTRGTTFITAHQLNRDTLRMIQTGKINVVKSFSAFFAGGSIGVSQEVDAEIFAHLETNHLGQKYLTMQRGKHRYVDDTPESDKYCAYPFTIFGIGDDLESDPTYVKDIWAVEDSNSGNEFEAFDSLL